MAFDGRVMRSLRALLARLRPTCAPRSRRSRRLGPDEIERMGEASVALARHYAEATGLLLARTGLSPADVAALGVHGQNDPPSSSKGFATAQPSRARRRAHGHRRRCGPAPATWPQEARERRSCPHSNAECFTGDVPRVVLNIGGIANISVLPARAGPPSSSAATRVRATCSSTHGRKASREPFTTGTAGGRPRAARQHDASRRPSERALTLHFPFRSRRAGSSSRPPGSTPAFAAMRACRPKTSHERSSN